MSRPRLVLAMLLATFSCVAAAQKPTPLERPVVSASFGGFLEEASACGSRLYARIEIVNGTDKPVTIAGHAGERFRVDVGFEAKLFHRDDPDGAWQGLALVAEKPTPKDTLAIPPRTLTTVYVPWGLGSFIVRPPSARFLYELHTSAGEVRTAPFIPHDRYRDFETVRASPETPPCPIPTPSAT
jgi:hypothetical protein